jgi:hypothetical protein
MVEEGVVTFLYLVFTSSHTRLQGKFYSLFTITFTITTITITTSISLLYV